MFLPPGRTRLPFKHRFDRRLSAFLAIGARDAHGAYNLPVKHKGERSWLREIAHKSGSEVRTISYHLVRF